MAVTIVSFRWLEILEKEFDKNFVDLDLLIGDLDADEPDFVHSARQKLAGLSSCFAQLTHKAQTIFQNSAKVEAELIDLRAELVNCRTRQEMLEEESRNLVLQLHSMQLDRLPSNQNPEQYKEKIETALKLSPSKSSYSDEITFKNNSELKKLKNELVQYQNENIILRNSILALHSEVYGAKLAAKYLDKELAGRIQQLQLLGKEMRTDVRDKLWRQLESEILLHRHKTVIRACRNRTNHEFVDSRILNIGFSDKKLSKNENINQRRNTMMKFNGTVNRRKDHEIKNKSDSTSVSTRKNSINLNNNNNYSNSNNNSNNNNNNNNTNNHHHVYHHQNRNNHSNENTNDINQNKSDNNYERNENDNSVTLNIPTTAESFTLINNTISTDIINSSNCDGSSYSNKSEESNFENNWGMKKSNKNLFSPSSRHYSSNLEKINKTKNIMMNEQKEVEEVRDLEEEEESTKEEAVKSSEVNEYKADEEKCINGLDSKKKNSSSEGEDLLCSLVGEKRTVTVKRQAGQGLGISITGGREHGVPILISELEEGGPAHKCKGLFVGDAILKVNDISLENTTHFEAVKILTNLETNDVKLLVQFIAVDTDEENSVSEDLYGFRYRFFDMEVMDSSDALGLHPLHSKSAHMPAATPTPTPDSASNDRQTVFHEQLSTSNQKPKDRATVNECTYSPNAETLVEVSGNSRNLIDMDVEDAEITEEKKDSDKLKIDLFGFRFQTDIHEVVQEAGQNLLDEFLVKSPNAGKMEPANLIQIETPETKSSSNSKKFEYVDEKIFSGLEDHSILDNIMKSFSEDDYSYLETTEKEKTLTSDSGLEVCLSGSDNEGESRNYEDKDYLNDWTNGIPEKIELKTLQHIFDRSFSSNLSSPRGSTSFDDDILSTEHSDEKSNSANDFKNKGKQIKVSQSDSKNVQKCFSKSPEVTDFSLQRSVPRSDYLANIKNDVLTLKKVKRNSSEVIKKSKSGRKSKDGVKKETKVEKRKILKDPELNLTKLEEAQKKREVNFKITDRFEENLIEYNAKNFDMGQASPNLKTDHPAEGKQKQTEYVENVSDELEETRLLSRRYGLKIPGKGVKDDYHSLVLMTDVKSPERKLKVLENHFRHFKPVLENSGKQNEKEVKSRAFRYSRYESFGDPDFGTPV